jgi:hypothetical protein
MLMRIATLTFVWRLHLSTIEQSKPTGTLSGDQLSYLKMLRTAARTNKNAARGVLVSSRCAAHRGAVL